MMAGRLGWRGGVWLGLVAVLAMTVTAIRPDNGRPGPALATPGELVALAEPLRQTEAEAVAAAKAQGEPIEIGAFRSERREVWANPDGTFTENSYQEPVRTVKNHRWVTPDATLERHPDGSIGPKAATFGMRISGGGAGPLLTVERAGRSMSLTWPGGPLPTPVVDGATATFTEVAPGLDLVVNVGVESFSHLLVVKTPEAARRAEVLDLALGLSTRGIEVAEAGDGGLAAVDSASRGRVFEAPAPLMWDSGDTQAEQRIAQMWGEPVRPASSAVPHTAKRAKLGVRIAAGSLRLTPDRNLLTDPGVRFPVYLDPVWQSTTTSFWAMVDSGYADTEYPKFDGAFQTSNNERAGYCPACPAIRTGATTRW